MAAALLFAALNSGELSPLLDGRADKEEFYRAGAKVLQNFIPLVQGPIMQRSGTGFVKEVKASANRTALIPFRFNVEQAYVIEIGDQYARFYKDHALILNAGANITNISQGNPAVVTYSGSDIFSNGMQVFIQSVAGMTEVNGREFTVANLNAGANTFELSGVNSTGYTAYSSGGTVAEIYEIATPWVQADLFDSDGQCLLSVTQKYDLMYIAHKSNTYAVRKLTRTGHTSWTLSTVEFEKGPFGPPNGDDSIRVLAIATGTAHTPGDAVQVQANSAIFTSDHAGTLFFMEEIYFDQTEVSGAYVVPWAAGQPVGTTVGQQVSNDGNVYSLLVAGGSTATACGTVPPTHIDGDAYDNPTGSGISYYKKWRYLHSRWCVVKLTTYIDSKNMSGTIVTRLPAGLDSYSRSVTGAADNGSGLIRITRSGHGFQDDDYVTIASVTGTTEANGDWKIKYVDADNFDLVGSTFANAYVSGGTVKRFATWKWAMGAFSAARGYPGVVAFHEGRLMLGQTEEEPDTFWLSESGSYESFAQRTANQILATNSFRGTLENGEVNKIEWALSMDDGLMMGTADGEFLLQAAQSSDVLGPNNFKAPPISGHGSRGVQPVRVGKDAFFVQKAGRKVRSLGYSPDPNQLIGTDMTVRAEHLFQSSPVIGMAWVKEPDALLWTIHANGKLRTFTFQHEQTVYAWSPHVLGGYSDSGATAAPVVESIAAIPAPDGTLNELWLIVRRYIDGGTKRFVEYMRPRWTPSSEDYTPDLADATMSDSGLTYDGSATATISGLWHLRGQTVAVLADGKVHPNCVVDTGGRIALNYEASVVQVGLPMRARFKSMRLETITQTGTAQGRKKIVNKLALRLIDATYLKYGRDFDNMRAVPIQKASQPLGTKIPLFNGDKVVDWPGEWGLEAYLCLENTAPVPCGIAGLFPELEAANAT